MQNKRLTHSRNCGTHTAHRANMNSTAYIHNTKSYASVTPSIPLLTWKISRGSFIVIIDATNNTLRLTSPTSQHSKTVVAEITQTINTTVMISLALTTTMTQTAGCARLTHFTLLVLLKSRIANNTELTHRLKRQSEKLTQSAANQDPHKLPGWKYFNLCCNKTWFPIRICFKNWVSEWSYLLHVLVRRTIMVKWKFAHDRKAAHRNEMSRAWHQF